MPTEEQPTAQEKTLFNWNSPARPFKPRSRDFYVKVISIAILFGVVLFVIDGIMPVLLIVALLFLFYVLSTVQPEQIQYKVTDKGIYIGEKRTDWDRLGRFWFSDKMGSRILNVEAANLTGKLEIMVPADHEDNITEILKRHLVNETVPPDFLDKAAHWASNRFPLE